MVPRNVQEQHEGSPLGAVGRLVEFQPLYLRCRWQHSKNDTKELADHLQDLLHLQDLQPQLIPWVTKVGSVP